DGLVYIIHPWESGRDAGRDNDSQLVAYLGRTAASSALATRNPGVKDPRWKQARFALLEAIQAKGTDVPSRQAAELSQLKSPDMAAHLMLGMEQAARVAEETGRPTEARQLRAEAQRMRQAVNRRMWDEADGF